MIKKGYIIIFILILGFVTVLIKVSVKSQRKSPQYFSKKLYKRFEKDLGICLNLPEVEKSDKIFSNAQYRKNKIIIGNRFFSNDYFTDEDRFSILFHEYLHYLNEKRNKYQCKTDKYGMIIQRKTDLLYTKQMSEIELEINLEIMKRDGISEKQIKTYREESKTPVYMRFIYAPSNLSRDELYCYYAEKLCDKIGIFHHSEFYRKFLISRIKLENMHFGMRLNFEKENKLTTSGHN